MVLRSSLFVLSFAATVVACSPASAVAGESVVIIRDGKPAVTIVADATPDALNRTVIDDLKGILSRMTGIEVPDSRDPNLLPVYVGEAGEFEKLPFSPPALEREAFLLKVSSEGIFLLGGGSLGTSHAVYTFLRDLGCRWVMPGRIGECLPDSPNLTLPVGQRIEKPDFRYRDVWYAYGCSKEAGKRRTEWLRRNRMYRPPIQHGHNLTRTLSVFAPFEKRPDLYSLIDGERKPQQICTSNPETVDLVVKAIRRYFDQNPEVEAYSLCPDDNADFCECENCRALDSGRIDSGGLPSVSDRYQIFLNQVLEQLEKTHPGKLVSHYAYNRNHTDPPVKTPVHPNTAIFITTSVYCSAHGVGDEFCASRRKFKNLLEQWTRRTRHVYIYEYDPVPFSGALPWPMWEAHGKEMPVYKEIGIQGLSIEGQNSWAAYFPNYYMIAQMLWDSSQDPQEVFEDMLDSFFLESAEPMKRYYASLQSKIRTMKKKIEWGLSGYPECFPPDGVEGCREALQQAVAMAETPIVKTRLEMVSLSFEEMDAYLRLRRFDRNGSYDEYQREKERLTRSIDRLFETNEDYILADIAKEKTGNAISDQFAVEQGFINRWRLCGPFDNLGMEGHDRIYPPEKEIDLTKSYEGKSGRRVSWKLNRTPEWRAYVDLLQEYDETDWVCVYALCWVTFENGPKKVLFRVGSNDSVKVFLNGQEVWSNKVQRVASVDDDQFPVTLPEGTSTVLLKIGQTGLNWGFYFRITDLDSEAVPEGLTVHSDLPK